MSETRLEAGKGGGFQISGELVFDTVPELLEQGRVMFDNTAGIELDFYRVTRADSAGLALLIEWTRIAQRRHRKIVFRNVPEQLLAIARVSGVETILPLANQQPL